MRTASLRRGREPGRELLGNLLETAEQVCARQAVQGLSSPLQMAADAVPVRRGRPRLSVCLQSAVTAMVAVLLFELLATLA